MAKKKQEVKQLSLFDDSFFETPVKQETGGEKMKRPLSKKDALFKELQEKARKQMEEAEKAGDIIQIEIPSERHKNSKKTDGKIQVREKRQRLRFTFPDGTQICNASATQTMIDALCKIGVERVAQLSMEVCHIPLVAQEVDPRYARWTKKIDDKWFLMAQSDTKQKYMQMVSIIKQLGIDVKVELGDFDTLDPDKKHKLTTKKKRKAQLEVTLGDKTFEHGSDTILTFLDVVERIGVDKVKKTGIQVGKFPIVTSDKKANNQIITCTGEWLTVPTVIRDKYKILRVISSMTHTPMEIKIIE